MPTPRICVLRAPGTNCDVETAFAFEAAGGRAERVHLFAMLDVPQRLRDYQILCLPGGFSYGDDLGAGVIFSRQLRGRLAESLAQFLQADRLMLGICNGFQVLLKAGLLPGSLDRPFPEEANGAPATLTWNLNGKYTALWVNLSAERSQSVFLRGIEAIELPIAHAEGRLAVRDANLPAEWARNAQVALRYTDADLTVPAWPKSPASESKPAACSAPTAAVIATADAPDALLPYPHNPNGSVANIAGLCDPTGRVLGLMPHPERFIHATQHPRWTRLGLRGEGDGMKVFRNAVEYFT